MLSLLGRAVTVFRKEGPTELLRRSIWFSYNNLLRPGLPRIIVEYNEVKVRGARFGDQIVGRYTTDIPSYEERLVSGIRKHVEEGDTIVVVGGGWGVSTVAAARQAGKEGRVISYEGSEDEVEKVHETIRLNDVNDRVAVHHVIVAQARSLRGEKGRASSLSPKELPDCDVLVLDCEGAEVEILEEMSIQPHIVIVETHGMYDATKENIEYLLAHRGYEVIDQGVAEQRMRKFCIENDIYVLIGAKQT